MTTYSPAVQRVPFNVVDEAIHLLNSEAEPWSVHVEVRVEASLEEDRLRSAVARALDRHPMARARKTATERRAEHRFYWEITPEAELDPLGVIDCPNDHALAAARVDLQSLRVPLAESPPLRMRLARHPQGDVVMLNVNHAASDAFGAVRLLRSVARAYAGEEDPVPDIDPLRARSLRGLAGTDDAPTKVRRAALLAEKVRDLAFPPARIAADEGSPRPGYGFHHVSFDRDRTKALVDLQLPGTVNDVLLAALNLAIAAWNREHRVTTNRIGVMVPINMRPNQWREEIVGNLLLPVRVSTDRGDRGSLRSLLAAIVRQTRRIKEGGTAAALMEVLGRSPALPLGAKEATSPLLRLSGARLLDTALLSNLARLDDPPNFGPQAGDTVEVWFSAPARMPLGLSIGVVTVAGRMHLVFRYRHPLFGPDAARRFAERYDSALDLFLSM
ncbi:MAG: hypothetical protein KY462_03305 [Actinobacteria bacterium]|nr:hypothetical protein [Actinomycetota bacterium]